MARLSSVFGLVLALMGTPALCAQSGNRAGFALKNGDRVVFYGDSITVQHRYTRLVEDIVISRYPHMRIAFYNAGVSGDTVEGGYSGDMETRVKRDILPWDPSVVTIMLGMNDGRYTTDPVKAAKDDQAYETGYRKLVHTLRTDIPGVRLTLIRPSPYDEITRPPAIPDYNEVMIHYGDFVSQFGQQLGIPVANFNEAVTSALRRGMKIDPRMAGSLLPDHIHPSLAGHWIMAAALVKGWHIDPVVSSVMLNAATMKVASRQNTTISTLTSLPNGIQWTQLDGSLPLPLQLNNTMTQFLLEISDIPAIDQQNLEVTGLSAQSYTLEIDGKAIAVFSRQELAAGVNLALYQTPMEQQAQSIDWTAQDRAKLSGTLFDLKFEGATLPGEAAAVQTLDKLDQTMIRGEYKNAQPKAHIFELIAKQN